MPGMDIMVMERMTLKTNKEQMIEQQLNLSRNLGQIKYKIAIIVKGELENNCKYCKHHKRDLLQEIIGSRTNIPKILEMIVRFHHDWHEEPHMCLLSASVLK